MRNCVSTDADVAAAATAMATDAAAVADATGEEEVEGVTGKAAATRLHRLQRWMVSKCQLTA